MVSIVKYIFIKIGNKIFYLTQISKIIRCKQWMPQVTGQRVHYEDDFEDGGEKGYQVVVFSPSPPLDPAPSPTSLTRGRTVTWRTETQASSSTISTSPWETWTNRWLFSSSNVFQVLFALNHWTVLFFFSFSFISFYFFAAPHLLSAARPLFLLTPCSCLSPTLHNPAPAHQLQLGTPAPANPLLWLTPPFLTPWPPASADPLLLLTP